MELAIGAHPLIKAVVIAGHGRFQISAIIEVLETAYPPSDEERRGLIKQFIPSIMAANELARTHGKLHQDFIVIAHPDKPFPRTPKSTIRRGLAIQLYTEELNRVYEQAELARDDAAAGLPLDLRSKPLLEASLRQLILAMTDIKTLDDKDDLFATAGIDSLQVLAIRRQLLRKLPRDSATPTDAITTALIYQNPSVSQLAEALLEYGTRDVEAIVNANIGSPSLANDLFLKYTKDLPPRLTQSRNTSDTQHIVLTGSTGSLGSYIFDQLMRAESVVEVWCLNRSLDAECRQNRLHAQRGLRTDFSNSKVYFLQSRLSEEMLGLQETDHKSIVEGATHIIGGCRH